MKHFLALSSVIILSLSTFAQSSYHVTKHFPIASAGGWDYIAAGPGNNRLYVSHGTQVNILNEATGDSIGIIPNTTGVHGIAFVPSIGKGYTSNGRLNNIFVFDLKTNAVLDSIHTGENPDAIMYEPFTKTIITCNGRSHDLTLIDPISQKLVATIPVGGKPETAVSDEAGKLFVNIEDKNEVAVIDLKTKEVTQRIALTPAEGPTGLSIDKKNHLLFVGCDKELPVIDYKTNKVVARVPIGDGCDGTAFDPSTNMIFASCGEGKLTIIHAEGHGKFNVVDNVQTKASARTLCIDEQSHTVFLPAADMGTPAAGQRRAPMIPGTFQVIVVTK